MEFTLKPFSEVISDVEQRIEHTKSLGADAPIRNYSDVYVPSQITDPEQFQLIIETIDAETSEIALNSRDKNIELVNKYNPFNLKKVSGWIMGSEVLYLPEIGYRHQRQLTGMFMTEDGVISKMQKRGMGPKDIPRNSTGYNSKLYTDQETAKLFKFSSLDPIRFTPEALTVSRDLVAVREYLAEFTIRHGLKDKLKLN